MKNSASDAPAGSLGFAVRLAHRAFDRALQRRIAPHGISTSQWYCLRALWEADALTQRQLSRATGVAENTVTVTVASMVRDGLVTRTRSSEDKRRQVIALTTRARALKAQLLQLLLKAQLPLKVRLLQLLLKQLPQQLLLLTNLCRMSR